MSMDACPHNHFKAEECPECSPTSPTMRRMALGLPADDLDTLRGQYYATQSLLVSAHEEIADLKRELQAESSAWQAVMSDMSEQEFATLMAQVRRVRANGAVT